MNANHAPVPSCTDKSDSSAFTRAISAESDFHSLSLMIRPDADLDGRFIAWDTEEREFIQVNGWLFSIEEATQ